MMPTTKELDDLHNYYMSRQYTKNLLFHYTKKDRVIEHIFANGRLRMGSVRGMNDPRETQPLVPFWDADLPGDISNDEQERIVNEDRAAARKLIREEPRVLCFTEDKPPRTPGWNRMGDWFDNQGFAHDRMWAQYAENHTGVCIFLDRTALGERMQQVFAERNGRLYFASVVYSSNIDPMSNPYYNVSRDERLRLGADAFFRQHRQRYVRDLFFTKHPDWESEAEYRYVWLSDEAHQADYEEIPIVGCVAALCLGVHFPRTYEINIEEIQRRYSIPELFRMTHQNGRLILLPYRVGPQEL